MRRVRIGVRVGVISSLFLLCLSGCYPSVEELAAIDYAPLSLEDFRRLVAQAGELPRFGGGPAGPGGWYAGEPGGQKENYISIKNVEIKP